MEKGSHGLWKGSKAHSQTDTFPYLDHIGLEKIHQSCNNDH